MGTYLKGSLVGLLVCVIFLPGAGFSGEAQSIRTREPVVVDVFVSPFRARIAVVGDLLMHVPIGKSVYDPIKNSYNFSEVFAPVTPYIRGADFALANLETRLAGSEFGYHGYPRLNTPSELAFNLRDVGFDLLALANNHCLDYGVRGILDTLDTFDSAGLAYIGNHRTLEERNKPYIADVNGIKIAFLNATESLNGLSLPRGYEYICDQLDVDFLIAQASLAREMGADFVVAMLHFGNENQREPTPRQRALSEQLCKGGIDVILGAHPHVVQPIERVVVRRGDRYRRCVVAYSLGNFLSCQRERYHDSGIILFIDFEKNSGGCFIQNVEALPVWVQKASVDGRTKYRILPVAPDLKPLTDLPVSSADRARMKQVWKDLLEMGIPLIHSEEL